MSAAIIVAIALGVVVVLFFGWVWVMNRLDERHERRERDAARGYHRGLP